MNTLPKIIGAFIATTILSTAGCGGGGGGSSDAGGVTPPPTTPPPTGGITRTGITVGPITGFGSIIVNGTTYDTSSTTFTKDGQPATQDDFSVGQVVLVKGSIDDDGTNATADTVEFDDVVEGPVSSVDNALNQIVVLGQTVLITTTTSIDDSCPGTLDGLLGVPAVEVSGLANANGVIEATRIECRDGTWDGVMEVNGLVSGHNAGAMTFMINGLEVDYSGAAVDNFPTAGVINDGDPVEAKGTTLTGSTFEATRVEYKGNRFANDDGDYAEIEGFITRFGSASDFDVSGLPVTTVADTTYEGGTAADLGLNLKVEVEGDFNADGVLVAIKVDIKSATAVRVTGNLDSVSGSMLTILGITVNTDSLTTRFEDKSDARADPLGVGDLNAGDYVEIRGQEQPVGQITALLVERDDPDTRTELRGFVEVGGKSEPELTVLGVTIVTNGATVYRDSRGASDVPMSAVDFWATVQEGSLVDARGTEAGDTTLAATELELQME
jgi:cytoskeletal protein CcmA (bactofilin family)